MMAGTVKRAEYFSVTTMVGKEKNNKDKAVDKHGTGCDKNYFNVSDERTMLSDE
jgi:hypothetical protein